MSKSLIDNDPAVEHRIFFYGPVCVGKGRCLKYLGDAYGPVLWKVGVGELVRNRIKQDPKFTKKHGGSNEAGDLIPDDVILPMVNDRIKQGREHGYKLLAFDGAPRNSDQAVWMVEQGILTKWNTKFIFLNATLETCMARQQHALDNGFRAGRDDNQVIEKRYELSKSHIKPITGVLHQAGIDPIFIDTNKMSVDEMAEKVLQHTVQLHPLPPKEEEMPAISPSIYSPQVTAIQFASPRIAAMA